MLASSSSVYGANTELPKRETLRTLPISPYAVAKLAAEGYAQSFSHVYGLDTVVLRYFNVFGPRQDPTSQYAAVIPAFIAAILEGRSPTIYGDGLQTRDFTYVKNIVHANLLACATEAADGEAVNVACGERISLLDLMREIKQVLGTDVEPIFEEARVGDVKHSLADISKAERLLGYHPTVLFNEGLAETIRYMQMHQGN